MKRLLLHFAILLVPAGFAAATPVGPGDVSGTWAAADSPFVVGGHITVPTGETLIIEPGVEVRFDGNYVLLVQGVIQAQGAPGDSILFLPHVAGTTWGHIEIPEGADDGSSFAYCRLQNGDARDNEAPYSTYGGALMAGANVAVSLSDCMIGWCAADGGGGLYIGPGSVVNNTGIHHCEALSNAVQNRGGGLFMEGGGQFTDCYVTDNVADFVGGGIYAHNFAGQISDCVIADNVVEGHGGGLGLDHLLPQGIVRNNEFSTNDAGTQFFSDGGGIYVWYASGELIENTIAHNTAPAGAGIAYGYATLDLTRNLIAWNFGEASVDIAGSNAVFNQTCVWGNSGGDELVGGETETLHVDPLFCDAPGGDYTLCADSACLPLSIGAYRQGCAACQTATAESSWSRVKSLY